MFKNTKGSRSYQLVIALFILLSGWWLSLYFSGSQEGYTNLLFGAIYGTTMSGVGALLGFKISKSWGGFNSLMGRAIILLSFGLLAQFFGQVTFSIYNIFLHIEIPYPSLADLGYFGNIPLYFCGALLLLKAAGGHFSLKSIKSQFQVVLIPLCLLVFSSVLFLREYTFDATQPLKTFLDFGYPIGQALYLSVAILTFSLSQNFLGGMMKNKIFFIIVAFIAQYIADFNFLFQTLNGTWYNGGYGDYLYLVAYFLMTLALLELGSAMNKLKH